ncbi:MAG: hypothetical protein KAT48_11850 [Bacteroidales bacterium]|nr:hypothetical protein [Bacteroidales bacterium]
MKTKFKSILFLTLSILIVSSCNIQKKIDNSQSNNFDTPTPELKKIITEYFAEDTTAVSNFIVHDEKILWANRETAKNFSMSLSKYYDKRETALTKDITVYFEKNRYTIDLNSALNKEMFTWQKLKKLLELIDNGWAIKEAQVEAWSSPDGPEKNNISLSQKRAESGAIFLSKIADKTMSPEKLYDTEILAHGEDWDGLVQALENSNLNNKNTIVSNLQKTDDPSLNEQILKSSGEYNDIAQFIFPSLRKATFTIIFVEQKRSNKEIAHLSISSPDLLSYKELIYAATLTEDNWQKQQIYEKATKKDTEEWRAPNNLACTYIMAEEFNKAVPYLNKASSLSPKNPIIANNMAAIALKTGDTGKAQTYIQLAMKNGMDMSYFSGIQALQTGNYTEALKHLNGTTCNHNYGLALLLTGNEKEAMETLKCAPDTELTKQLIEIISIAR